MDGNRPLGYEWIRDAGRNAHFCPVELEDVVDELARVAGGQTIGAARILGEE